MVATTPVPPAVAPVYDLIVVGAGIGGLTAAALAAQAGLATLVLEAHNRPGGCAGDFALNGVLFPAGATLISGFEPGGLHDLVYRRLGLASRAIPLERSMEIVTPERRFSVWTDRGRWQAEWRQQFPDQAPAVERFFDWSERLGSAVHGMAARLPVLPPRAPRDLLRLAAALRPELLRSLPYLTRTAADVMAATGSAADPRFRQLIDAQLLDATGCTTADCAAINAAIAIDLYHHGCFALPGGTAAIARDLVRALRRDGGGIQYQTAVVGLRRDSGGRWLVQTADGGCYRARGVIANVPAWDLPALLGGQTPRRLRNAGRLRNLGWGAVVLHAAVDPAALPPEPYAYAQVLPPLDEPLTEGGMCFITLLPQSRRPGAPRAVSVSTHTDARPWWGLEPAQYAEHKQQVVKRLLANCERAYPGFRAGVRFARAATPRTFAHYTLRGFGLVGGVRNDVRHALLGAVSHHSGAPGLYLCGDTVFPGQGTIGVTLSGINAWRSACDYLGIDIPRSRSKVIVSTSTKTVARPLVVAGHGDDQLARSGQ